MARRTALLVIALVVVFFDVQAQVGSGTLKGKLLDQETGEPIPFTNVTVLQGGNQVSGASTNIDGQYVVKPLDAGVYTIQVTHVEYNNKQINNVRVSSDQITFKDIKLAKGSVEMEEFVVEEYKEPLIKKDGSAQGMTMTSEDIQKMPSRGASGIASQAAGVSQNAAGGLNIRGSRDNANYYFIDGVKVRGSANLPQSAIEEVSVLTGGMPAKYGDATGGIINISTKGARESLSGGFEAVSSGFRAGDEVYGLDSYGYNLFEGTISGPLLKKKDSTGKRTEPLLGFLLSANYTAQEDPRPSALDGWWVVKDSVRQQLVDEPLRRSPTSTGAFYNAEYLTDDAFKKVKTRPNAESRNASLTGKLNVHLGSDASLSFGGSMNYNRRRSPFYEYTLFNSANNPLFTDMDWRVFGKFSQQLGKNSGNKGKGGLSNVFYSVMVDYSRNYSKREDFTHGDNFFNYGYLGKFETFRTRSYDLNDQGQWEHTGFRDTLVTFDPSDENERMAAVTTQYFDLFDDPDNQYENFNQITQNNGLLNGQLPASVYDLWTNVGSRYNNYSVSNQEQFRVTANGSADLGDHALQLGFEYEQRVDRSFSLSPVGLWTRMRQMANFHIEELDTDNPQYSYNGTFPQVDYERKYAAGDQFYFDEQLRQKLGYEVDSKEYIDVDELDPSTFSLNMFTADELLNDGNNYVTYYGYDHTGDKTNSNPSFDDFFTKRDENGNYARPIGPYEPIYMAGYVMDKFSLDDIVFNVGLRVSRFDANQSVLKDKYLLHEARTAGEVDEFGNHPANVGDDYVVYVNDIRDPSEINGYRSGDTWYNADGEQISDPSALETGTGIAPYLVGSPDEEVNSSAFEDYKPQLNFLPRIAFSFNITDKANFFAHYDILAKRPTEGVRLNPTQYLYMENQDVFVNNPNLQPEKTIDYELGFQQVLSKSSSLKLSAFYREMRNMVQVTRVINAYPKTYKTFGNLDFGTVKGLTATYDLRRTNNIWIKTAYTLQFANGTGSSFATQAALINSQQPNLRTVAPLNFDQRHQFNITADYRFPGGKDYNGPEWGRKVFQRMGLNIQSNISSGTPYTGQQFTTGEGFLSGGGSPSTEGGVNGSRKPWQFRVDAQLDRDITLEFGGKEEGEKKKTADLNIYLRVNNLFNTLNVTNVYRKTGNPDDDGYLTSARFQREIESSNSEESFRDLYRMKVNNPYNYGLPRTIRLGVRLNF